MFRYFDRVAEYVYRVAYCEGDFDTCARRQRRLAGESVPDNLMPQGTKLWPDGGIPPKEFVLPGT